VKGYELLKLAAELRKKEKPVILQAVSSALDLVYRTRRPRYKFVRTGVMDDEGNRLYRRVQIPDWEYLVPYGDTIISYVQRKDGYAVLVKKREADEEKLFDVMNSLVGDGFDVVVFPEYNQQCFNTAYLAYYIARVLHHEFHKIPFNYYDLTWIEFAEHLKKIGVQFKTYEPIQNHFNEVF